MAYKAINPKALTADVNPAERNSYAIEAGFTGWEDYQNNKGSAPVSSGVSGGSISSGGSYSDKYLSALQTLRSQPSPLAGITDTLTDTTNEIIRTTSELASQTLQQVPLIATIYDKLATALESSKVAEIKSTETIGKGEVGRQKAALASEGVSAGTGAVAAPVALAEEKLRATVATVIDKYQIKAEQYAAEEAKTVSDLQKDANEYKLKGLSAAADLATKLAQLKLDEEKLVQSIASDIAKGESDAEKAAIQQAYNMQLLELKQQQAESAAELASAKLAIQQSQLELAQAKFGASGKSELSASEQRKLAGGLLSAYTSQGSTQGQQLRKSMNSDDFKAYLMKVYPDASDYVVNFFMENKVKSNF